MFLARPTYQCVAHASWLGLVYNHIGDVLQQKRLGKELGNERGEGI